ncbi:acyl carrier protein [Rhodobacter capsulatus YW2]|nr:acyl carrier protein [Rhodobacter capsulatus YW2]
MAPEIPCCEAPMLNETAVRTWITDFLVSLTGAEAAAITGDAPFYNLGIDSVDAVVMAGAMEEHFGTEIEATLVLRNATIDELIADLRESGLLA